MMGNKQTAHRPIDPKWGRMITLRRRSRLLLGVEVVMAATLSISTWRGVTSSWILVVMLIAIVLTSIGFLGSRRIIQRGEENKSNDR